MKIKIRWPFIIAIIVAGPFVAGCLTYMLEAYSEGRYFFASAIWMVLCLFIGMVFHVVKEWDK